MPAHMSTMLFRSTGSCSISRMARPIICGSMAEAVEGIPDGIQLLIPGFGPGTPHNLVTALFEELLRHLI